MVITLSVWYTALRATTRLKRGVSLLGESVIVSTEQHRKARKLWGVLVTRGCDENTGRYGGHSLHLDAGGEDGVALDEPAALLEPDAAARHLVLLGREANHTND